MEEQYRFTIQMKRERSNGYNSNNNRWFLKQCFKIPTCRERESRTKGSYWGHTSQLRQGHQVIL